MATRVEEAYSERDASISSSVIVVLLGICFGGMRTSNGSPLWSSMPVRVACISVLQMRFRGQRRLESRTRSSAHAA